MPRHPCARAPRSSGHRRPGPLSRKAHPRRRRAQTVKKGLGANSTALIRCRIPALKGTAASGCRRSDSGKPYRSADRRRPASGIRGGAVARGRPPCRFASCNRSRGQHATNGHVADSGTQQAYRDRYPLTVAAAELGGMRTLLAAPMLKEEACRLTADPRSIQTSRP